MASTDYFIPSVSHISSHTHLLSLIYDEMNEAMRGLSKNAIDMDTHITRDELLLILKDTGLARKNKPPLLNSAATMKAWRKIAFLVACIGFFPINSRSHINVAIGDDWIEPGLGDISLNAANISPALPKSKEDRLKIVLDLCLVFGGDRHSCAFSAINTIQKSVKNHAHLDHRNIMEWPPKSSLIDTAVEVMANRHISVSSKVIDEGVYGKLKKIREGR